MATIKPLETAQDDQQEDQQGVVTGSQAPSQNTSMGGTGTPNSNQFKSADKQPKGSGRFTNINKYLNANKGGGQKIASAVGGNIQKGLNTQADKTKGYNTQLGDNINQAKQANTLAGQQNQQLGQIGQNINANSGLSNQNKDLGINQFTQDPNFNKFQNFQAGREVNENLLGVRQQDLANAADQYTQQSQQALNSLASQSGRFDLLKDNFGGNKNPQYTTGQQRLDEIFFSREGLGGIKSGVQDQLNAARGFQEGSVNALTDVRNLTAQEQQLIGDINTQSRANATDYTTMLDGMKGELNQNRNKDWTDLESTTRSFMPNDSDFGTQSINPFNADMLRRLNLTGNEEVYDTFDSINGANDFATKGRDALDYTDIANQQNVDAYSQLAKMANLSDEEKKIKQASTLGDSYTSKDGDMSLSSRIKDTQNTFMDRFGNERVNSVNDTNTNAAYNDKSLANYLDTVTNHGGVMDQYNLQDPGGNRLSKEAIDSLVNSANGGLTRGTNYAAETGQAQILRNIQNLLASKRRAGVKLGG